MSEGRTRIAFDDLPDSVFMQAVKVREMVKARALSPEERKQIKRGAPNILASPFIGQDYYLSREDLIKYFRYTNGKKIKTTGWESKKQYVVYRDDNTVVYAMQLPLDNMLEINGVVANGGNRKRGDYIICLSNEDGSINRATASILSAAIFRKLCYIPMNDVIEKHQGSRNTSFKFISRTIANHIPPGIKSRLPGTNRPSSPNMTPSNAPNLSRGVARAPIPSQIAANGEDNGADLEVVAQVHDGFGKRVGFVIRSSSGAIKKVSKNDALRLANSKKLRNATIVAGPSGDSYLRGVGIQLDNLPIEYQ